MKYLIILLISLISYEAVSQIGLYRLERADSQNYVMISDTLGVWQIRSVDSLEHIMPSRAYGEMFVVSATPDTLTFGEGSTTPQKVNMSSGFLNGFSHNSGTLTYDKNDTITVNAKYTVSYSFSEGTNIHGWIYKNGSAIEKSKFTRTLQNPNDEDIGSGAILMRITTDDTIEFYMSPGTHSGGDDLIITDADLNVIRVD